MGISKLTCTLKGEVLPKWSLDEGVPVVIDRRWRMWAKFSIILSLCRVRACSSNKLIELSALLFLFSSALRVSWMCESDCFQERQAGDSTCYTRTSSRTCIEKRSRAACSDTTDPDYFWHETRAKISRISNNITEMYQRCNHKHRDTISINERKCTKTKNTKVKDSLEWWQLISEKRCHCYPHSP